jgi:type VI secretion system VgrG family protein
MRRVLVLTSLAFVMTAGVHVMGRLLAGPRGSGAADPSGNGDVNGSGRIDITDAVYLLNWLFSGGPEPVAIAGAPELEARVRALESSVANLQAALPGAEGWERTLASVLRVLEPEEPAAVLPPGALRKVLREPGATRDAVFSIDEAQVGEVAGFISREEISRPFECLVLLRTAGATLNARDLVGRSGRLLLRRGVRSTAWSGVVSDLGLAGIDAAGALYTARVEPHLARLGRTKLYRVFQGESTPSIVGGILDGAGVPPPELRIQGTYPAREFVAQYRETDFDFASRLMEEDGIFYFFDHEDEGHAMVLGNTPGAYGAEPDLPIIYRGHEAGPPAAGDEYIHRFQLRSTAFTGAFTVSGHDFETGALPEATATAPGGQGEAHEYEAAGAATDVEAARLASIRLGEVLGRSQPGHGASSSGELRAGRLITVEGSMGDAFNGKYLVTGVTHRYVNPPGGDGGYYGNEFTCIPASVPFRPARRTPVPRVAGVETAVVIGAPGEEIHTDKYGRVKVQFHWDRTGSSAESSAWIRMAMPAAGKDRGMFMLPEVGDEVLVAFEHGDTRFPYVLGALWNGTSPPPRAEPGTTSSLGTNRSSQRGANEIVFDDTAGAEGIEVRAPLLELVAPATVAQGALRSAANAGAAPVAVGERHRDNAIVAWARIAADGGAQSEFGVREVLHPVPGVYVILLDASASGLLQLVTVATPVITNPPRSSEDLRIASVTEVDNDAFEVHINDGTGRPVDNAFMFLATAR